MLARLRGCYGVVPMLAGVACDIDHVEARISEHRIEVLIGFDLAAVG